LFPSLHHHVYPIQSEDNSHIDHQQRQKVEIYIFTKLEEYSKKKSINLFRFTSISHIRQRLRRDIKSFSKQFYPNIISEQKLYQWIDEILEQIQSHISKLQSLLQSQDDLEYFLTTDKLFSSKNMNNQWKQIQLQQAKKVLFNNTNDNIDEILSTYENYIIEKLTPKKLENARVPFINHQKINLDEEYQKVEIIGREYLTKMFDNYKQRQHPNIQLIKEMINLGMEQMIKRPKREEFRQASNILTKATFILKSKQSYLMNLQNVADDFMVSLYFETELLSNLDIL
jgi:hypothetical protein